MFLMLLSYAETVVAFFLWILFIGNAAMIKNLPYHSEERTFRKKTRRARIVYVLILFIVLIQVGMVAVEWGWLGWELVEGKVWTVLLPLMLPVAFTLAYTLPTLNRIASGKEDSLADFPKLRRSAANPVFVVPVRAAALGSFFSYWNTIVLSVSWWYVGVIFVLSVITIWLMEQKRYQTLTSDKPVRIARKISVAVIVIAVGFGWFFLNMVQSRLPDRYSMMDHQNLDFGGQEAMAEGHGNSAHQAHHVYGNAKPVSVTELKGPSGQADRRFTLVAQKKRVRLTSGKVVDAWTFNGQIPGPELRVREGDLVEVTLINKDIREGVTIHWHGLNVPNREDGVAGVTQDAVQPGERYVYRFQVNQVGTYWYHSHQQSDLQVEKGLFGSLVVDPEKPLPEERDITVLGHRWKTGQGEAFAFGDADTVKRQIMKPGTKVRLRLVNTSDLPLQFSLSGTPFQVVAIDGNDVHQPDTIDNQKLKLAAGGRYDVRFTMPNHPVFLTTTKDENPASRQGLLFSPDGKGQAPEVSGDLKTFEPARYGKPKPGVNPPRHFNREYTMVFDNKMGFYDGRFNALWLINGKVFPETPMLMVKEGEWVKTTFINRSGMDHPMHLHGHHMLVLSKNGKPVSGSPWWTDTLNVAPGESYVVAFRTNNPGIWMDHCHNFDHAKSGMMLHLSYEGITSPFMAGRATKNQPE